MQQKYSEQVKQELRLKNYSFKTIKDYISYLKEYFDFRKFNLEKIDGENIKQFLMNLPELTLGVSSQSE